MNREGRVRDTSGLSRQRSSSSSPSSSNHLIYLFIISAASVVLLPHVLPILSSMMMSSGKDAEVVEQVKTEERYSKRLQPLSPPSTAQVPGYTMPDYAKSRVAVLTSERKCEVLEGFVSELQKVVQMEREKVMQIENVIRGLQVSDSFIKEKIQYLEDKTWEVRKNAGSGPLASIDIFQNTEGGKETASTVIHSLLKMVQIERERITALETEIRFLRNSESVLENKVEKMEDQFAAICKKTNLCDAKF